MLYRPMVGDHGPAQLWSASSLELPTLATAFVLSRPARIVFLIDSYLELGSNTKRHRWSSKWLASRPACKKFVRAPNPCCTPAQPIDVIKAPCVEDITRHETLENPCKQFGLA